MKIRILILLVFLTLLPIPGFATQQTGPKSGASCIKANQILIAKGKIFTCTKVKKKWVWIQSTKSQSVPAKVPAPAPTPSSAPTPTPTPSSGSTPQHRQGFPIQGEACLRNSPDVVGYDSNWVFVDLMCNQFDDRYFPRPQDGHPFLVDQNTGLILPPPDPVHTSLNPFTKVITNTQYIFSTLPISRSHPAIQYIIEQGVNEDLINLVKSDIDLEITKLGDYYVDCSTIYIVISNTLKFAQDQSASLGIKFGANDSAITSIRSGLATQFEPHDNRRPVFAGTVQISTTPVIFVNSYPEFACNPCNQGLGAHELFHTLQGTLAPLGKLPTWWTEGSAAFLSSVFTSRTSTEIEQWKSFMELVDSPGDFHNLAKLETYGNPGYYSTGSLGFAYLVNKYGFQKQVDFALLSKTRSWQDAFQSIFGQSVDNFYSEAQSFIDWFWTGFHAGTISKSSFG